MNPNTCRFALRARDPLECVDLWMVFLRVGARELGVGVAVVAIALMPALVLACAWFEGAFWLVLPALALAPPLQAVFTLIGGRLLFEERVGLRTFLGDLLRSIPAILGLCVVRAAATAAAALTCGVGLTLTDTGLAWVHEAALLERAGPARAARRAMRLASGEPADAVSAMLVGWSLTAWAAGVGEALGQAVVRDLLQLGQPFGALAEGVITPWFLLGLILAQPLFAWYRLLLYVNARTRSEGWDVQVALRAAAMEPG